jgi:microcystin-dependent protein
VSNAYLGEIRAFPFGWAPAGWALCDGQLLPISQYQALFNILGTTYGGDGRATFALPDLRGRTPFHVGAGLTLGQAGGEESHALSLGEMPTHTHTPIASGDSVDTASPQDAYWANAGISAYYSTTPNTNMASAALATNGGGQPHDNLAPYLTVCFVIALVGDFPSHSY